MNSPVGPSEIRVLIRPIEQAGPEQEFIPAQLFKKILDAFLAALIAADRELHAKSTASEFFVSHLARGSYEFGLLEKQRAHGPGGGSAIELFRRCAGGVYRSDYQVLLRYRRLTRAFHRIVKALDPAYVVLVQYHDTELPMDGFFCRQVDRVGANGAAPSQTDVWFAGTAIASLEGRLEAIDYRGPVWKGWLTLGDGETQLECVFNRSIGEDALNPFGNKFVSVSGQAIYTGDSQIPERIEVMKIELLPRGSGPVDIRGSLEPASHAGGEHGDDHIY